MKVQLIEGINPILQIIVLAMILLVQGTSLFILAKKRGKKAWLWGLFGIIQFPFPSIFYYFIVVRVSKKQRSEHHG